MRGGVLLEEMVLAAVSGELELGADADDGAGGLGPGDGLLDVAEVGVEVHGPLVEVAGGHPQKPHLAAAARISRPQSLLNWIRRVGRRVGRWYPGDGWSGPWIRRRRAADLEGVGGGRRPGQVEEEEAAGRRWSTGRPDGCEVECEDGGRATRSSLWRRAAGGRWGRRRRSRRKGREGRPPSLRRPDG